jgi:hypothetical protein
MVLLLPVALTVAAKTRWNAAKRQRPAAAEQRHSGSHSPNTRLPGEELFSQQAAGGQQQQQQLLPPVLLPMGPATGRLHCCYSLPSGLLQPGSTAAATC